MHPALHPALPAAPLHLCTSTPLHLYTSVPLYPFAAAPIDSARCYLFGRRHALGLHQRSPGMRPVPWERACILIQNPKPKSKTQTRPQAQTQTPKLKTQTPTPHRPYS